MRAIEKTDSPAKAKVMSAYDQIVQLGLEQGLIKAAFKTFKKGMQKGLSLSDLIDLTEISEETALQWQKLLQDNPEAELPEM